MSEEHRFRLTAERENGALERVLGVARRIPAPAAVALRRFTSLITVRLARLEEG